MVRTEWERESGSSYAAIIQFCDCDCWCCYDGTGIGINLQILLGVDLIVWSFRAAF
jgi:hypothetical protein